MNLLLLQWCIEAGRCGIRLWLRSTIVLLIRVTALGGLIGGSLVTSNLLNFVGRLMYLRIATAEEPKGGAEQRDAGHGAYNGTRDPGLAR